MSYPNVLHILLTNNNLSLNTTKLFNIPSSYDEFSIISINNIMIDPGSKLKYLGIIIIRDMSLNQHIQNIWIGQGDTVPHSALVCLTSSHPHVLHTRHTHNPLPRLTYRYAQFPCLAYTHISVPSPRLVSPSE